MCEICSKSTIKTPKMTSVHQLIHLTHFTPFFIVSVVDFEQVNVSWVISLFFVNAVLSTNKISIFLFLGGTLGTFWLLFFWEN